MNELPNCITCTSHRFPIEKASRLDFNLAIAQPSVNKNIKVGKFKMIEEDPVVCMDERRDLVPSLYNDFLNVEFHWHIQRPGTKKKRSKH